MIMTITEGLAEIKTISKRLAKKRQFVLDNLFLEGRAKDPFENEGGSTTVIVNARQSILDLEARIIDIRSAINKKNMEEEITITGITLTVADWILWRREVAPGQVNFLNQMRAGIANIRVQVTSKQMTLVEGVAEPNQVSVFVKELALATEIEKLEETLGTLDGQLSLKNATVTIEV